VNIPRDVTHDVTVDEIPGNWTLAWDKLTGNRRKFRLPSLMSVLMNATTLNSAARQQGAESMADLELKINLPSVGFLDWHAFDHAVNVGYKHTCKVLKEMPEEELAPFR